MTLSPEHKPVLLEECLEVLQIKRGGRYIDCTIGGGGHALAILEKSSPGGKLLGLDADPRAIEAAGDKLIRFGNDVILVNENFRHLEDICTGLSFCPVDGILLDLGMSSLQLAEPERGFSFQQDAPLDMRFSPTQTLTAADIVNGYSEADLSHLLYEYGEERRSRQIARRIAESRPLETTLELARTVEQAVGGVRGKIHPATRTFQALRIAVNEELGNLKLALAQSIHLLTSGGRVAVISFHSLEDRLVKDFFRRESTGCLCPPRTPMCLCGHTPSLKSISRKPVRPLPAEVAANPRSRSAKLRVAELI
ncbi:16S rRNA (cytosine(1402)-N(4))-methyltransferase RsmH [Chloroflexota bacterium]